MRRFRFWTIIIGVLLMVGGGLAFIFWPARRGPTYDIVTVERRDISRSVQVTGTVKPAREVHLAFEVGGRIVAPPTVVDVGSRVRAGNILAQINPTDLLAARAQAAAALAAERAQLAERRAGTRTEEVAVAETDVANAQRAHADAQRNLANVRTKATSDINARYADVVSTVRDAFTKADHAVRTQTDELFTNDATTPQLAFRTSNLQAEIDAEQGRRRSEDALHAWARELVTIASEPAAESPVLDLALDHAHTHLVLVRQFLDHALAATLGAQDVSQATITTYTTNLNTARTNVNTVQTAVDDLRLAISAQRVTNQQAIDSAAADVNVQHSALTKAQATLRLKEAGATTEQIQAQEAAVEQAAAALEEAQAKLAKATLRAPFDGVVTVHDAEPGSIASSGSPLITLIADAAFEVEANIPEVDLAGLVVGTAGTVTLDAYGQDTTFPVSIQAVDPAATEVDGVPTYRTRFAITTRDERIRAGMSADVAVVVESRDDVLAIPQRAVIRRNGDQVVRVLQSRDASGFPAFEEVTVTTGLRGSDGYIEILDGLTEGQMVVRSVVEA